MKLIQDTILPELMHGSQVRVTYQGRFLLSLSFEVSVGSQAFLLTTALARSSRAVVGSWAMMSATSSRVVPAIAICMIAADLL